MNIKTMESYLVEIGADIDKQSFDSALSSLRQLKSALGALKYAAAPLAIASAIGAVGKAAADTIKDVASADMEYQKLAKSMWTTKETAKSLSVAMKTMGVSQDDIAWVPELRQQFFRLRAEMQRFATPADADAQLRYIREIGYDVQALLVRLKMLKEWIAYYLIRYLEPHIESFRAFIEYLLDKLGTDMPSIARKVARAMASVLNVGIATLKVFSSVLGRVYEFIVNLPDNVKKWGAVFSAVGAVILAGPFGRMLMALSVAMLLIEDFIGYINGWESSSTLAPVWDAILNFANGPGRELMDEFQNFLEVVAKILDKIFNGINIGKRLEDLKPHFKFLLDSLIDFAVVFSGLINDHEKGRTKVRNFWHAIGDAIGQSLDQLGRLASTLGFVIRMIAALSRGDFKAAETMLKGAAFSGLGILMHGLGSGLGIPGGSGSSVVSAASQYAQGTQWMDPSGANTDPKNQCASFASAMMRQGGVDVQSTMNGDNLAMQFKELGAYHAVGDGYQPQPGDLIDWAGHVGIYAGNGEYIARNSLGGVTRGSMAGAEEHFGRLWGFGSIDEYQASKRTEQVAHGGGGGTYGYSGASSPSYASSLLPGGQPDIPTLPGYAQSGESWGNTTMTIGSPNITITVPGTNATPEQISDAVSKGVKTGFGSYLDTIRARNMRRAVT